MNTGLSNLAFNAYSSTIPNLSNSRPTGLSNLAFNAHSSPMSNSGTPTLSAMSNLSNSSTMPNLSNSSPMSKSGKPTFNAYISNSTTAKSFEHWHSAFGHVNSSVFRHQTFYEDGSLLPIPPKSYDCEPCSLAKSTHHVPSQSTSRASKPLELIHSDLSGKAPVPSLGGSYYYLTFIDDFTRYAWIYFLKKKSDATAAIKDFITLIENQTSFSVKRFRSDQGGEYLNEVLEEFFAQKGIQHDLTPLYNHESNGVAKRFNRIIQTMVRAMLLDMKSENPVNIRMENHNSVIRCY